VRQSERRFDRVFSGAKARNSLLSDFGATKVAP
jgi:hypothetical protein